MAETAIGNSYLTVKARPAAGFGSEVERAAKATGQSSGANFGGAFSVMAGNLLSKGIETAMQAVTQTISQAFNNFADNQQLKGGVAKLFGDNAADVMANASRAFETVGIDANKYMEQVTSFSASLISSLNGDTATAVKVANTAMTDMADNANTFGTDIASIQYAYQGFAKQNYTMLDNLKLGYGGTKAEMERLLADASKLAGVEFNIDSYSDVINAIHVMQEEMSIAGTTSVEAAGTVSGSINMLSAAWQNFLTGIFDESADMGVLGENVMNSLTAVFDNILPLIGVLVTRIFGTEMGGQINTAVTAAFLNVSTVADQILAMLDAAMAAIIAVIQPVIQFLTTVLMPLISSLIVFLAPILSRILTSVSQMIQRTMQAIQPIINMIVTMVMPTVTRLIEFLTPILEMIAQFIDDVMTQIGEIIAEVMSTIAGIIEENWPTIQHIIELAMTAIQFVIETVWPVVSSIILTAISVIRSVIEVAMPIISGIISGVFTAIQILTETVWPVISGIITGAITVITGAIEGVQAVVAFISGVFDGIRSAIETPINAARDAVSAAIDAIKGFFSFDIQWPHIPLPHFYASGSINPLDWISQGPPSIGIDWYANGGFVDGATLIGAGEAGPEMILPREGALMDEFAGRVASQDKDSEELLRWLQRNLGPIIAAYAPTLTRREFDRLARGAMA